MRRAVLESEPNVLTRIEICFSYEVEVGGAFELREFPLYWECSPLSRIASQTAPSLKDRKFIRIGRNNFAEVPG
jgi:predicted component of type VI protein secretion system